MNPTGTRKARRQAKRETRRWQVKYELLYDDITAPAGLARKKWTRHYRTLFGARVNMWFNVHALSWGGSAALVDTHRIVTPNRHSTGKR